MMNIRSEDGQAYLRLVLEATDKGPASLACTVEVKADGFHGLQHEVWVFVEDLRTFVQALQVLDKHRSGSATLRSMSPEELALTVFALDQVGHLGIRVNLTKDTWLSTATPVRQALTVAFTLDATSFLRLVQQFQGFLAAAE